MKLTLTIAEKLLLLLNGGKVPASQLRYPVIEEMIMEGILHKPGKLKSTVQLADRQQLVYYLFNRFAVDNLSVYVETLKKTNLSRKDLVEAGSDSKIKNIRSFKGFLVNCYSPIAADLNGDSIIIAPPAGTFTFIFDFESFVPEPDVTIVGIENPENFRYVEKQQHLFGNLKALFVSRYPQNQSKDLLKWLQAIPNNYLHFGDFDFAGIGIYLNEYKKHLGLKANFFIPENIEEFIARYGSKKRYDSQKINFNPKGIEEENLSKLIAILHKQKKGLDQEIFIKMWQGFTSLKQTT